MPHTECVAGEEQKPFTVRDISELVRQGQDLMVQVVKDPLGTKGARLTTDITLPLAIWCLCRGFSRWGFPTYGKRSERERLKKWSQSIATSRAGLSSVPQRKGLARLNWPSDAAYLKRVWTKVMERKKRPQTRISCTANWRWRSVFCVIRRRRTGPHSR